MSKNIEVAIGLVKQAIDQDKKKNYEEAARCYREALVVFNSVARSRGIAKGVKQAITLKCNQYEERLKKLDRYLLTNADLSQLFKDVVTEYHKRPDSQSSFSQDSISSETWKSLKNCPLYRQGIEAIERGKKKDQRGNYTDALHYYEDGMTLLLEASADRSNQHESQENIELLRFKCLLIHERIEMIRNHLEGGVQPKPINDSLDTIEYSLTGQSDSSMSPEPYDEEDKTLRSDELGSLRSLNHNSSMASIKSIRNDTPQSIPLADLDGELKISNLSLASSSSASLQSIKSYNASFKAVDTSSNYGEADFNVTELTVANSGLDLEVYLNGSSSPGSDSGISDQSPKVEPTTEEPLLLIEENAPAQTINRYRHESSAYASSTEDNEDKALLEVHRNGDGTLVIDQTRSSPPAVKLSPSASMKRQAKLKAEADELTVLSQDVIDTALLKSSNAKASANTITAKHQLDEYVPPRAYARREDDEEDYNKGCYYFIACLDSFWIL